MRINLERDLRFGVSNIRAHFRCIYGNTIQNNGSDGIGVFRLSHADIATNTINANGTAFVRGGTNGNGISVSQNSSVQLGEDNPATPGTPGAFTDQPNTTTVNNANFGIRCVTGGNVRGHLGPGTPGNQQLNGAVSQFGGGSTANTFSGQCHTIAASLSVP